MDEVHSGGVGVYNRNIFCLLDYKRVSYNGEGIWAIMISHNSCALFLFVTDFFHHVTVLSDSCLSLSNFCTITSWVFKSVTLPSPTKKCLPHAVAYCKTCLSNPWIILLSNASMLWADPGKSTAYFLSRDHVCETHPYSLRTCNHNHGLHNYYYHGNYNHNYHTHYHNYHNHYHNDDNYCLYALLQKTSLWCSL